MKVYKTKQQREEEALGKVIGCGCLVIIVLIGWGVTLWLAGQLAVYLGHPAWVGIAMYALVSGLLTSIGRVVRR